MNNKVIGTVKTRSGVDVPLLDIHMMSDEHWQELARENAVHNFRRAKGREPASVEEAVKWQRERVAMREAGIEVAFC